METPTEKIIIRLRDQGFLVKVIEHEPIITIDDVVRVLQIPTDQMAKTILLFNKEMGLIAIVLPGMNRIDYGKVSKILDVPRKSIGLADRHVLKTFDLNSGDMCPFYEFFSKVIVDTILLDQQTVFCGSGDSQRTIVIDPKDMVKATRATIANVSQTKSVNPQTKGGSGSDE